MAVRGWGGPVATAIGVAAGAGAAQLGLGYGLGIVAWLPSDGGTDDTAWVSGIAWATWIAATATIAGAVVAQRTATGSKSTVDGGPVGGTGLWRLVLAVAAAVGGLVTVLLVAVPARAAVRTDTFSPQTVVAGYAVLGVLVGLLAALWALGSPAVARNVVLTACWLWLLAVVAVVHGVFSGRGLGTAQLGVWQMTTDAGRYWFRDYLYWPGAALSLGSALLIGVLAARRSARHTVGRIGAAVSGVAGPLLVAVAYLLAAPRLAGARPEQLSAHLTAPYAVVFGLAGSVLVAWYAQRAETAGRLREARAMSDGGTGHGRAAGTTDRSTSEWIASSAQPSAPTGDKDGQVTAGRQEIGTAGSAAATDADPTDRSSTGTASAAPAASSSPPADSAVPPLARPAAPPSPPLAEPVPEPDRADKADGTGGIPTQRARSKRSTPRQR